MATTIHLRESVKEAPVKSGGKWRVIVARPGKGSSGNYSAEVLEKYAPIIVPAGAQSFLDHDYNRSPKDMIGFYEEAAYWDEEEQAVVAELSVFSHWGPFVDEVGPHCGMSLYAMGTIDEDDNVTEFLEDSYNGADLVSRPGLKGSGLDAKLYEEAHKSAAKMAESDPGSERKEIKEMDEETKGKIDALIAAITPLVTGLAAKAEESQQVEDTDKVVAEAVAAYDAAVEAIDKADLFPSQVESLRAEAKAGKDVTSLIEQAKKVKEEAESAVQEKDSSGRVLESDQETKYGAYN